ncbi:hypothetical protein MP638_006799 [Amoeboaphelidium occidentale]|nr:hypothetical protein MP638_006799 [Amoeboaphelidium occidentale]
MTDFGVLSTFVHSSYRRVSADTVETQSDLHDSMQQRNLLAMGEKVYLKMSQPHWFYATNCPRSVLAELGDDLHTNAEKLIKDGWIFKNIRTRAAIIELKQMNIQYDAISNAYRKSETDRIFKEKPWCPSTVMGKIMASSDHSKIQSHREDFAQFLINSIERLVLLHEKFGNDLDTLVPEWRELMDSEDGANASAKERRGSNVSDASTTSAATLFNSELCDILDAGVQVRISNNGFGKASSHEDSKSKAKTFRSSLVELTPTEISIHRPTVKKGKILIKDILKLKLHRCSFLHVSSNKIEIRSDYSIKPTKDIPKPRCGYTIELEFEEERECLAWFNSIRKNYEFSQKLLHNVPEDQAETAIDLNAIKSLEDIFDQHPENAYCEECSEIYPTWLDNQAEKLLCDQCAATSKRLGKRVDSLIISTPVF